MDESKTEVMILTRESQRGLRYAALARSKEKDHPVLHAVQAGGDEVIGADGYRLHAAHVELPQHGLLNVDKISTATTYAEEQGDYPNVESLLDNMTDATRDYRKIETEFLVDAQYLREALTGMGGVVRVRLYDAGAGGSIIEVLGKLDAGKGEQEISAYALVMGVYPQNKTVLPTWRPFERPVTCGFNESNQTEDESEQ